MLKKQHFPATSAMEIFRTTLFHPQKKRYKPLSCYDVSKFKHRMFFLNLKEFKVLPVTQKVYYHKLAHHGLICVKIFVEIKVPYFRIAHFFLRFDCFPAVV
jgi:hypothetical protein